MSRSGLNVNEEVKVACLACLLLLRSACGPFQDAHRCTPAVRREYDGNEEIRKRKKSDWIRLDWIGSGVLVLLNYSERISDR